MGGIGSGPNKRTWTSTTYRLHQQHIHEEARAGLDLGVRYLTKAEIARDYPTAKQQALLIEMQRQRALQHQWALMGVTVEALR